MGSVGVVYRQLLKALRFANGCRGATKESSSAYKSQTRRTLCRSINNPAGAPPPLGPDARTYTLARYVCVCTRVRVRVYPLSHGGVVIRRVPPVAGVPGRSDEEARSEREGGDRTKAAKAERTLLFTYPHWPAREGTGTFAHFIRA